MDGCTWTQSALSTTEVLPAGRVTSALIAANFLYLCWSRSKAIVSLDNNLHDALHILLDFYALLSPVLSFGLGAQWIFSLKL
ncbi:hypothetical protein OBBRIDRAFT_799099 [Obba rivulosa]|uniref:Uncharacterized protein n=1 Tax=Obba rivulosa TaxID=1052685 RepID=A0A8E2DG29_9APHY|nr:hypothetical protein OBBRIDRAFT_799099 [Obba rivulosa]